MSGSVSRTVWAGPEWSSITSADLLVSLRVPRGWGLDVRDETTFALLGPKRQLRSSRATMTVSGGAPEQPGRAWFEEFAVAVPYQLEADVEGLQVVGSERFTLSSMGADVLLVTARRVLADRQTSHLQAYVWAGSYRMLEVTAQTARRDEDDDLPVLRGIVCSLRLLPPR